MRQSHFLTLFASDVKTAFPSLQKMTEGKKKKLAMAFLGALILPRTAYRAQCKFVLPYLEIVVTPRCNLRCAGCANLMPMYKGRKNEETQTIKASLDAVFAVSGEVSEMTFIGGEPFLNANLHELIEYALKSNKAKKVKVTTNGSITPKDDNLECLKDKRVTVSISEYPTVDRTKIISVLKENNINYFVNKFDNWEDYGSTKKRSMKPGELKTSFSKCPSAKCKSVFEGCLFACPRSAHGRSLGVIPHSESEYVDLINTPKRLLKKKIKALYSAGYIGACDHCNPVWARPGIACGLQLKPDETME